MERKYYSKRTGVHNRYVRHKQKKSQPNYFFIKANICLGMVICTIAAVSMENEGVKAGCEKLASLISANITKTDIESKGNSIMDMLAGNGESGGIYTFAGEKNNISLSEDIRTEIKSRSNIYEQNNKGAPQQIGLSLQGE